MSRKKVDLKLENVTIEAVAAEGKALTHDPAFTASARGVL